MQRRAVGSLFFERGPRPSGRPLAVSTHLACRGDEEMCASMQWAAGDGWGSGELIEFLLPAAYSKLR
jgi:hypothetical protein